MLVLPLSRHVWADLSLRQHGFGQHIALYYSHPVTGSFWVEKQTSNQKCLLRVKFLLRNLSSRYYWLLIRQFIFALTKSNYFVRKIVWSRKVREKNAELAVFNLWNSLETLLCFGWNIYLSMKVVILRLDFLQSLLICHRIFDIFTNTVWFASIQRVLINLITKIDFQVFMAHLCEFLRAEPSEHVVFVHQNEFPNFAVDISCTRYSTVSCCIDASSCINFVPMMVDNEYSIHAFPYSE